MLWPVVRNTLNYDSMYTTLKQKVHEIILHLYLSLSSVYTMSTNADLFYSTEKNAG